MGCKESNIAMQVAIIHFLIIISWLGYCLYITQQFPKSYIEIETKWAGFMAYKPPPAHSCPIINWLSLPLYLATGKSETA